MKAPDRPVAVRKREVVVERVGGAALLHEDARRACRRSRRRARCRRTAGPTAGGCASAARTGRSSSTRPPPRGRPASADAACRPVDARDRLERRATARERRGRCALPRSSRRRRRWPASRRRAGRRRRPAAPSRRTSVQRSSFAPRAGEPPTGARGREPRRARSERRRGRAAHALLRVRRTPSGARRATGTTNRIDVRRGEKAAILLSTRPAARPAFCTSSQRYGNPSSCEEGLLGKDGPERARRLQPLLQIAEEGRERALGGDLHHQPRMPARRQLLHALDQRTEDLADRPDELAGGALRVGGRSRRAGRTSPRGPSLRDIVRARTHASRGPAYNGRRDRRSAVRATDGQLPLRCRRDVRVRPLSRRVLRGPAPRHALRRARAQVARAGPRHPLAGALAPSLPRRRNVSCSISARRAATSASCWRPASARPSASTLRRRALEIAEARRGRRGLDNVRFVLGDVAELRPLPDALRRRRRRLRPARARGRRHRAPDARRLRRVLKKGGFFVAYTPNREHYVERMKAHDFLLKQFPEHIAVRRPAQIRRLLEEEGWRVLESRLRDRPLSGRALGREAPLAAPGVGRLFRYRILRHRAAPRRSRRSRID